MRHTRQQTASLDEAIYNMGHSSETSVREAAQSIGLRESNLYRMLNPYDDGANLPARLLVKAMNTFNNILPFKVQASHLGFLVVKAPFGRFRKAKTLAEFQHDFLSLVQALVKFSTSPTSNERKQVLILLKEHMQNTAHLRARCEKDLNQIELNF